MIDNILRGGRIFGGRRPPSGYGAVREVSRMCTRTRSHKDTLQIIGMGSKIYIQLVLKLKSSDNRFFLINLDRNFRHDASPWSSQA